MVDNITLDPHNREAEEALLGSLVLNPGAITDVMDCF